MFIKPVRILPAVCVVQCEVSGGSREAFVFLFLLCCPQKEEGQTSRVFMSDHLKANQCVLREAESGRVLAEQQLLRNAWFTFQFSGLAKVTTCLLAWQAYWRHGATGQKQLLYKDTPSNYFQQQHTI